MKLPFITTSGLLLIIYGNLFPSEYAVVSFKEGGISVVPKFWLINKIITYWPKNSKNLRTLIIRAGDPNLGWPTYKVTHIYGFYENYDDALNTEKEAVKDSESEFEDRGPGKRKQKPKEIYSPPPSFPCTTSGSESVSSGVSVLSESPSKRSSALEEALVQDIIYLPENRSTEVALIDINDTGESAADYTLVSAEKTTSCSNLKEHNTQVFRQRSEEANMMIGETSATTTRQLTQEKSRRILPLDNHIESDEMSQMFRKLDDIQITLKFILLRLNSLDTAGGAMKEQQLDFSGLPPLPLKSVDELLKLEDLVNRDEFRKKMGYKLLQVSGKNETDFVRRGLACIFTNHLANLCSWTGQKNNFRIKDCIVTAVLKEALQRIFPQATDKIFEVTVMEWFRHANQRLKRM